MKKIEGRYPYTYCADFIRSVGPQYGISPALSRADASHLKSEIARAIGMDEHEFASKIADAYMKREGITE